MLFILKGRDCTWIYTITWFSQVNQDYVVTSLGLDCRAERTTCSLLAVAAVTFSISLSSNTKGADNNSVVPLADMDLVLNKLNTLSLVSVIVIVIVSALPESSDTNIDFIIEVVADGTVYSVVMLVVVKSTFLFTNELAKEKSPRFCFVF